MFSQRHRDGVAADDNAVLEGGLGEPESIRLRAASALTPRVDAARVALTPLAVSARERVVPAVAEARETLAGAFTPAGSGTRRGTLPTRAQARHRSAAALAALRGELPRRHRHWPMALLFLLAGAGAGAVASVLSQRSAAPSEPTYIRPDSTPVPVPPTAASAPDVDETLSTESGLGWPEQLDDSLAKDSSETHKPTV